MQVKIENDSFFVELNYNRLDSIFDFFTSKRHIWLDIDLEIIEQSKWYKDLGKRDKKDLKELFVRSTRPSSKNKTILIKENNNDVFNIDEAYFYLNQPLTIVVENYEYEPDFINSIFTNFGDELLKAKNKHWLKFENGAGKNDNAIKGMLKELFNDSIFTKNKENYLRCFSIKDSDRKYSFNPKELPQGNNTYLKDNNIPHHILYKRAKENYMPDSVMKSFDNNYFNTLLKTFKDELKKDFFDITKGFNNKNKSDKDWITKRNEEYMFFEIKNIDDSDFKILKKGVDNKEEFKRSFSKHFNNVNKDDLEKRIQHQPKLKSMVNSSDNSLRNEFEHIVYEIKYLL